MRITKSIIMMMTIDYTHQLSLSIGSHTEFSDRQPLSRVAHTLLYLAIPEYLSIFSVPGSLLCLSTAWKARNFQDARPYFNRKRDDHAKIIHTDAHLHWTDFALYLYSRKIYKTIC
jgi:hypothetical protein